MHISYFKGENERGFHNPGVRRACVVSALLGRTSDRGEIIRLARDDGDL